MSINTSASKPQWNYFLALEQDLANVSRYVEFAKPNMEVYSIELAHILLAAASEVDVLAKSICEMVSPKKIRKSGLNIKDYQRIFTAEENALITGFAPKPAPNPAYRLKISALEVSIPRYGLTFVPWENWASGKIPDWWHSYNKVKHERDQNFHLATLKNAINAVGALLVMNYYYYRLVLSSHDPSRRWYFYGQLVARHLEPESTFLRLPKGFYSTIQQQMASMYEALSGER